VPSIYCHRLIEAGKNYKKPFEKLIFRDSEKKKGKADEGMDQAERVREIIARRAALEFQDGMYG
jgi:hypothetical protein